MAGETIHGFGENGEMSRGAELAFAMWEESQGSYLGAGSPEGVLTAPPGSSYRDTAGTAGAWIWLKKTGTGNTGWSVVLGDTGWRNLSSLLTNGWALSSSLGTVAIRRVNDTCFLHAALDGRTATADLVLSSWPAGFDSYTGWTRGDTYNENGTYLPFELATTLPSRLRWYTVSPARTTSGANARLDLTWPTISAWPTALPGTAA